MRRFSRLALILTLLVLAPSAPVHAHYLAPSTALPARSALALTRAEAVGMPLTVQASRLSPWLGLGQPVYERALALTAPSLLQAPIVPPYIPYTDVRRYGARGDGTTDDRVSLQNAIAAAATGTGLGKGIVYLSAGTYKSSAITWNAAWDNVRLVGAGPGKTFLVHDANGGTGQFVTMDAPGGLIENVSFENMTISGLANTDADCGYDGINARQNVRGLRFINIHARYWKHAFWNMSATSNLPKDVLFDGCAFYSNLGGGSAGAVTQINGGVILGQCDAIRIVNCVAWDNATTNQGGHFIYWDHGVQTTGALIANTHLVPGTDATSVNDIVTRAGNIRGLVISNCSFGPNSRGIQIGSHEGWVLEGCTFYNARVDVNNPTNGGVIQGCSFYDDTVTASGTGIITSGTGPSGVLVEGCSWYYETAQVGTCIDLSVGGLNDWTIRDNFAYKCLTFVNLRGDGHQVVNNTIRSDRTSGTFQIINIENPSSGTSDNNRIERNTIRSQATSGNVYAIRDQSTGTGNLAVANVAYRDDGGTVLIGGNGLVNHTLTIQNAAGTSFGTVGLRFLSNSTTWDPTDIGDGTYTSTTVTVIGAALGDLATAGFSLALPAGCTISAAVTAADTVTVTLRGNQTLGSGTVRAVVIK